MYSHLEGVQPHLRGGGDTLAHPTVHPSTPQTLCEQLRKENEALKAKLDKGLEQRDQAAERLR